MKSKDLAQIADDKVITNASYFVVNWFIGRSLESYRNPGPIDRHSLWERAEFTTLAEARAAVRRYGQDPYGRWGLIYAVGGGSGCIDVSVFVDDNFETRVAEREEIA